MFNLDWTVLKNMSKFLVAQENLLQKWFRQLFLLSCSGSFFSLAGNFHFLGNRRWTETPLIHHVLNCTHARSLSSHHTWCYTLTRDSSSSCAFHKNSVHLSHAMSRAIHGTLSTSSTPFSSVPGLQRLLTSRNPCADPREPGVDGYTDPEPRTCWCVFASVLAMCRCGTVCQLTFFRVASVGQAARCWSGPKLFSWSSEERENKESRQIHEDVG